MSRNNRTKPPVLLWAILALLLAGLLLWTGGRESPPEPALTPLQTPVPTPDPYRNDRAQFDVSRLSQGVVRARSVGGAEKRLKVQITKEDGRDYNYDLNTAGDFETFPLTEGEGNYTLRVLEQVEDKRYTPILTCPVTLTLPDPNAPFLEPNQFVRYGDTLSALAARIMAEGETDAQKTALAFDYVADYLAYDDEKAETVEPGYLPDLETVLAEGKGICFDYAALLCAMLRSQDIPCKLQVGDSGNLYHAWVEVWCETEGLVDGIIPITPGAWTRLDPTFVSSNDRSDFIFSYVTDEANYVPQFTY